jgi:hypothetical protein
MAVDLTGRTFGQLVVIRKASSNGAGAHVKWECRCACGGTTVVASNHLQRTGGTKTCGCGRWGTTVDMVGRRFGRLVVVARNGHVHAVRPTPAWLCQCDCGRRVTVAGNNLRIGQSTSCGCFHREWAVKRFTTHGLSGTPELNAVMHANRRARQLAAGGTFTAEQVRELYKKQDGRCVYCPKYLPLQAMQRDHIMPLALGGSNDIINIQLLCRSCNQKKHALHPTEFARRVAQWNLSQ